MQDHERGGLLFKTHYKTFFLKWQPALIKLIAIQSASTCYDVLYNLKPEKKIRVTHGCDGG